MRRGTDSHRPPVSEKKAAPRKRLNLSCLGRPIAPISHQSGLVECAHRVDGQFGKAEFLA